jgi:hypothetical protein
MGKRLSDEGERINQRSIGFRKRQTDFFAKYPQFRPDEFCREAIDNQIKQIDPEFLSHETTN